MDKRIIGIIGAFDENGVYGIGPHLPWGGPDGRSLLRLDMGRFVEITKKTAPEGKKNVLVVGRGTMEAMNWRPLPDRRTIVLSQTLSEEEAQRKLPEGKSIAVERSASQAVERALRYEDCANIYFGGGYDVWLQALKAGLCTHAFITVVMCDSVKKSTHAEGWIRRAPEMLREETFPNMRREVIAIDDTWNGELIPLHFHNYEKM